MVTYLLVLYGRARYINHIGILLGLVFMTVL